MDCTEVRAQYASGAPAAPERVAEHAAVCGPCAELADADGALGRALGAAARVADEPVAPGLAARVRAQLDEDRGVVGALKSLSTSARITLANAAVIVVAGAVLLVLGRPDLDVYPLGRMTVLVALHAVVVALALRASLRGLHLAPLTERRRLGLLAAAVALPLGAALLPQAHAEHDASLVGGGSDLVPRAVECFSFGAVLAVPVLLLLVTLDRGGARTPTRVALFAAAAGVSGALGLQLHCPIVHPSHLVLGHGTLVAAVVLIWVAARRLMTSPP